MAPKKVMFVAMGSEVEPGRFSLDLQTVDPVIYRPDPTTDAEPSVPVPNAHELHQDIVSGRKAACESKQQRTPRQIQAHIHYVQRSLNLAPGISGQWSRQAQDVLDTWLLKDLKGVQKRNMLALEDKPPAESSCSKAVGNIVESSEALDSQPKDEDANIFEDHHSEALDSQPNDDNMMDEDCVKETTPKDGKAKVQGLGDVLEIEENLAPGDDGVKIQERIADWFACSVNGDIIYKYIDGEQNLQVLPEPDLNDAVRGPDRRFWPSRRVGVFLTDVHSWTLGVANLLECKDSGLTPL
ncbi:Double-strand break repair protein MRE11A [Durusdinium trenchii]|uniref:Double-strand break repair protein MRE11A n=1 Tax=Durusdinium trenchii TaxID=1381693 RepID=A0ABP0H5V9_9DINO